MELRELGYFLAVYEERSVSAAARRSYVSQPSVSEALANLEHELATRLFAPLGMKGVRKLHDIFIDRKLPRVSRSSWPVVMLDGVVLWVPGMVRSRVATITPATKNILYLQAFSSDMSRIARLPENPSTC